MSVEYYCRGNFFKLMLLPQLKSYHCNLSYPLIEVMFSIDKIYFLCLKMIVLPLRV